MTSVPLQAGITTTLNSRCSVLAAANSIFGRWDETKGEENIDFMPTILSRFDMIFIVKDDHNEGRDVVSNLLQFLPNILRFQSFTNFIPVILLDTCQAHHECAHEC